MVTKGKIKIEPPNKKAIFFYIFFTLLFFGAGITFFVLLLFEADVIQYLDDFVNAIIAGGTWTQYWWVLVVILIGLAIIGFLVGWLLLVLTAKYGDILVIAGSVFFIIGGIIGGLLCGLLLPGGFLFALPGLVPAGLMLLVMIFSFNKVRRAGEFLKFTGKVVLAEKGMILAPLFVTFISVLNFLTIASIYGYFIILTEGMALPWLGYVLGTITSLIQMIIYYGIFYASEAINTTYAYEWYRKRDPDMKFCLKNVLGKAGPILTFGVVTALVQWIQRMLRNAASRSQQKGNIAGIVLAILARILASLMGIIFKYLTYFTLPAIVIEGHGFKDGVKRSFNLLKKYYMDVLIRETGVSRAFGLLQFIAFFLYGVLGAIAGIVLHLAYGLAPEIAYPLTILSAIIFAFIPTFFIFRPMKTAYLTFVFAYAQDEETRFSLPTRMPKALQGELKDARKSSNKERSIANLVK